MLDVNLFVNEIRQAHRRASVPKGRHEGLRVGAVKCLGWVRIGHELFEKALLRKVSLLFWTLD